MTTLLRRLFLALALPVVAVIAQQKPNPLYSTSAQFAPGFFRQNVCHLQERFNDRNVTLEDALQGLELRTYFVQSEYFRLNPETGAIDEDYPGLKAVLLDKLAERAGFTWRDSYAVTGETPEGNYSWTELLLWSTETWDVSIDWWAFSIDRVRMGLTFPEGWYDGSIIMVSKTSDESTEEDEFSIWAFLRPFDNGVWWLILGTIIFSGLVYWILENIDKNSDKRRLETNVMENIWLSAITFTTHFEFRPRTNAARMFTLSLSFWAMIVSAAYTANLASFLVVRNAPQIQIETVADAVRLGVPICTQRSAQSEVAILKAFPNAQLVQKETEKEVLIAARQNECAVAITTVSTWDNWQRNVDVNGNCNMNWIGRPFKVIPAGFSTYADSGTLCTSLITDVLNYHMLRLKEEGFVEDAWEEHLNRRATIDCTVMDSTEAEELENEQLSVANMAGIFAFHGFMSAAAIIVALIYHLTGWDKIPRFAKEGPLSRAEVRKSLAALEHSQTTSQTDAVPASHLNLVRAASRKTFVEHIGGAGEIILPNQRPAGLDGSEGTQHLTGRKRTWRHPLGFNREGAVPPRGSTMGTKRRNMHAGDGGNRDSALPQPLGTASRDEMAIRNDIPSDDSDYLTSDQLQADEGGQSIRRRSSRRQQLRAQESEALLNDLLMNDLHGPAVSLHNQSQLAEQHPTRVKFSDVAVQEDGTEVDINFQENGTSHGQATANLLHLSQRQDEQSRTMQVMSTQISQIMELLQDSKKSSDE